MIHVLLLTLCWIFGASIISFIAILITTGGQPANWKPSEWPFIWIILVGLLSFSISSLIQYDNWLNTNPQTEYRK
jgi:hypothetical protein